MGFNKQGQKDGTGPFKGSFQHKQTGNKGKIQLTGQKCPKAK